MYVRDYIIHTLYIIVDMKVRPPHRVCLKVASFLHMCTLFEYDHLGACKLALAIRLQLVLKYHE